MVFSLSEQVRVFSQNIGAADQIHRVASNPSPLVNKNQLQPLKGTKVRPEELTIKIKRRKESERYQRIYELKIRIGRNSTIDK